MKLALLGDRAFGYDELDELLKRLGWDDALRFRGNITSTNEYSNKKYEENWVFSNGRFTQGKATQVVKLSGRRFSIEETFRDTKVLYSSA